MAESTPDDTPMVKLCSREGAEFVVPRSVALMSNLIKETLPENEDEDHDDDDNDVPEVPLPNVATDILEKVVAYMKAYKDDPMTQIQTPLKSNKLDDLVQTWYCDFVKVDKNMMFDLVAAANYMDIKPLLDLTCLAVSILIKGKSAAELREMFNIQAEEEGGEGQQGQQQQQEPDTVANNNEGE